jgi:hypothetical protein
MSYDTFKEQEDKFLEDFYFSIVKANQKRYEEYESLTPEEKGKMDVWVDSLGQINFKCIPKQTQKEGSMAHLDGATTQEFLNAYPAQFLGDVYRKVVIKKVHNGWIITIGCATFVETDWKKVCNALKEYWDDPVKAEKKYYKK